MITNSGMHGIVTGIQDKIVKSALLIMSLWIWISPRLQACGEKKEKGRKEIIAKPGISFLFVRLKHYVLKAGNYEKPPMESYYCVLALTAISIYGGMACRKKGSVSAWI